jgi:hypothetical protein
MGFAQTAQSRLCPAVQMLTLIFFAALRCGLAANDFHAWTAVVSISCSIKLAVGKELDLDPLWV